MRGKKKSVDSRYLDMRAKVEELQCGTQKDNFLTKKKFSWKDTIFRSDFSEVEWFSVLKKPRVILVAS